MKVGIIISVMLLAFVSALVVYNQQPSTQAEQLEMSRIQQEMQAGAQLIDVRTAEEFAAGHIQDAVLLPLQDIEAGTLPNISKEQALYVYCRSGNRSAEAVAILQQSGYTNVIDLGGMDDVVALGGTVVQ